MTSLRQKQIHAIKQMLNLNQVPTKAGITETVWKVLIYDRIGQDIISPLISVKELRELGVTLFVQLHSDRDPIPEVPAIYFCTASDENLDRIGQDFRRGLYDIYNLNFISPISRQKLEDLAMSALSANCVANIHKVYDQYVNFITLEEDLFILRHQNSDPLSYYEINKTDIKDTEMELIMNQIVDHLFSLFVTLGAVPVIRCPRGNAAEMVANKLNKKLKDNLFDARNNLFQLGDGQTTNFVFQRPICVILDRHVDMATLLHHTWTYQALAHDVLNLSLNRLTIDNGSSTAPKAGTKPKPRTCELDAHDRFWCTHKGAPFPTVAEAIQEELEQYRTCEDQVKKLKSSMGISDDAALTMVADNTTKITSAVNSLPQLVEKKRLLDMHTSIASSILNEIKCRKLDTYFELEEKVMSKTGQATDKAVLDLIQDENAGSVEDKMRLFLIYFICASYISDSDLSKFEAALTEVGCNLAPLAYVKRWKNLTTMTSGNQYEGGGTKTVNMFSKLVSHGSNFVMEGVKNLVVKRHNLPVTKIVDHLMEFKNASDVEDFLYLDPKLLKAAEVPRNRAAFQDAYVVIVGGGNYIEYQNLMDYARHKTQSGSTRRITYGATTLTSARQFLSELTYLGEQIQRH